MSTETNVLRTRNFLFEHFAEDGKDVEHRRKREYRVEHSLRAAELGGRVARAEGLDEQGLIIGCLLHDIAYADGFNSEKDWLEHGRNSAKIARPFLETLGLERGLAEEICYGIAIHVDDKSDFEGERSPLALSIGDCDNIDRFGAFRIYENMSKQNFAGMPLQEQLEHLKKMLEKLEKYLSMGLATETAGVLWRENVGFYIEFYSRLKEQLEAGEKWRGKQNGD